MSEPNSVNNTPRSLILPRAKDGRAERQENRRELTLLACPTCKGTEWLVSISGLLEVHLECCGCPPAPAVKLTVDHLRAALTGRGELLT